MNQMLLNVPISQATRVGAVDDNPSYAFFEIF